VHKLLRSIQVFFPFLQNSRFAFERFRQRMGRPLAEPDFNALRLFDWGPAPLFLDVGANRGLATDAMRLLVPQARIIACEPNPILYPDLRKLYGETPDITCLDIALGDMAVDATLWVPIYRHWIFDGLGSLDRDKAARWLNADRLYFFDRQQLQLREYTCRIRPLDSLDLSPAFIKIDVQGHELQVLRGGEQTLRRCRPLLMVENPKSDAETAYLQALGYTICAFDDGRLIQDRAGKVNSFFLTADHLAQLAHA
jgi:FkbM family methyltransferase